MATKDTTTARDQGRQQGSETGNAPSYGQQGSGAAGQRTQQSGWQAPGTGQQGSRTGMQAHRAGMPTSPYYGAFGGSPFCTSSTRSSPMGWQLWISVPAGAS